MDIVIATAIIGAALCVMGVFVLRELHHLDQRRNERFYRELEYLSENPAKHSEVLWKLSKH